MHPTFTPAFFSRCTSHTPDLRVKLELGQWLTPAPVARSSSTSAVDRWTQWARMVPGPSSPHLPGEAHNIDSPFLP